MDISKLLENIVNFKLFEINNTSVTPFSVIIFISIIIIFNFLIKFLNKIFLHRVLDRSHLDEGTKFTLHRLIYYVIMLIVVIFSLQFVGIDFSSLAVIFSFLSVGIGFGLQSITSNFISGLILLFERPITVGDRVTVGDAEGEVTEINMRSTTIRTLNNISIIVPNNEFISSNVVNWSHGDPKIRLDIEVGVSYDSDLDLVLDTLKGIAANNKDILSVPKSDVLLVKFGASSWDMVLRAWISDPKLHHNIRSDINCEIVRAFRDNNIEIPFPQNDVHLIVKETKKGDK